MANDKVPAAAAAGGALEEAVVRRGTVVWGGSPHKEGGRARRIHSGPGQKVTLPRATVAKLRKAGVLRDPDVPEIPVGLGPNFNIEDGVQVGPSSAPADAPGPQ